MKLSEKRKTEIYGVVHNAITDLRIAVAKLPLFEGRKNGWDAIDDMIGRAGDRAAREALEAAEGKHPCQRARGAQPSPEGQQ